MAAPTSDALPDHTFVLNDSPADGATPVPPSVLPSTPKQIGPYKILRELGRGAMGTVYEAQHAQLERRVALKVLPTYLATSPKRLQRFRREMAVVGRLDHPNIVLATDAGEVDGQFYIAMQFVDGPDLDQVRQEIGRFEPADACEIIRQTALGLEHIGQQELVHRDIKPANIVLNQKGEAKILDLGIAMLRNAEQLDTSMTIVGSMMGTPDYIAPEQITRCADVDIRADIYSLGCTLYCLLSGRSPFNGPGYTTMTAKLLAHASITPPSLAEAHAEIPEGIIALVKQMMSKNPDDRPSTPAEVAELITPFCDDADLVPVATGQRKEARLKPLDLPALVESEQASTSKSTANQDAGSIFGKTVGQKFLVGGAVAAAFAGALWLGTAQPISNSQSRSVVANKDLEAKVGQTQAMLANINDSIAESVEISMRSEHELAKTLRNMQAQLAKRQAESGVQSVAIANPKSPIDHYYNACLYSKMGDHENAKTSYAAYFANELPVVDPHMQFVALLKAREGIEGARATYNAMPGDREFIGRKLALAMLEPENKVELLEKLIANHQECSPAVYLLSQHFDQAINTTLTSNRRQRELLQQFVSLHEQGQVLPYFLDQSIPAGQLDQAKRQLKELMASAAAPDRIPVRLANATNRGHHWRLGLAIAEKAEEIFWSIDNDGEFASTGQSPGITVGHKLPNPYFQVPLHDHDISEAAPVIKVYVKYRNVDGEMQGPFALDFDPKAQQIANQLYKIKANQLSWVRFKEDKLLFQLFLMGDISLVKAVHYSFNEDVPKTEMPVPKDKPSARNADSFHLPINDKVKFVSLQVTFADGTDSDVVKIYRE